MWLALLLASFALIAGALCGWRIGARRGDWPPGAFYVLKDARRIDVGATPVTVRLYCSKASLAQDYSSPYLPQLVLAETRHARLMIPLVDEGAFTEELNLLVPRRRDPLLAIQDDTGGNAFNHGIVHLVLIPNDRTQQYVGEVTAVADLNGDGTDDLVTYDDRFEANAYTCHADAPAVPIFWKVHQDHLCVDNGYGAFYRSEIARLEKVVAGFPHNAPAKDSDNQKLISAIFEEALVYNQLGLREEGLKAYRGHIRHFGAKRFYLGADWGIPVAELERYADRLFSPAPYTRYCSSSS